MKQNLFFKRFISFTGTILALLMFFLLSGDNKAFADDPDTLNIQIYGSFDTESARGMLESVNTLRAEDAWYWNETDTEKVYLDNLQPLVYDYELERVAMQRAAELAVAYSHTRPNGQKWYSAYPDSLHWACGENIAHTYTTADSVFTAWSEANKAYAGQGHRRNMLNPNFRSIGIGCFQCDGRLFWAMELSSEETGASSNTLPVPVGIDTLPGNLDSAYFGKDRFDLISGNSLNLTELGFYIKNTTSPKIKIPCVIRDEDCVAGDAGVVKISDGKLIAQSGGNTTLSATVAGLSASTSVYVREATPIVLNNPLEARLENGEIRLFSFIPTETTDYSFFSSGRYNTHGYLYDQNLGLLADSDDISATNWNFMLSQQLTAGTQYYFGARLYPSTNSEIVTLTLMKTEEVPPEEFSYTELKDGSASITGCSVQGDVVIPSTIDGLTVTNLAGDLFYEKSGITSVTIPATVTYFGDDPDDNDWDYVFSCCYDLENIVVDTDNPTFSSEDGVLYSKDKSKLINYPCNHSRQVFHVSSDVLCSTSFSACRNLKFLFLDNNDIWWYQNTFSDTGNLTVFYLDGGDTVYKVNSEVSAGRVHESDSSRCRFENANRIYELPEDLEVIKEEAFQATGIQYLRIPDGCRQIETGAFSGGDLLYVRVGESTKIAAGAFDHSVVIDRG